MNTKTIYIFLAGGGNAEESKPIDERFVGMLDLSKPLVYIPNAMRSKPYQACLRWFRSVMNPLGVIRIEMWDDLRRHLPVDQIAGVYLGGGDTVKLLKEVREAGFNEYLREVARQGLPLYGGSAGAIILGEDIRTAPEANQLEAKEAVGLGLVSGYSIFCHYKTEDQDIAVKLSNDLRQNIIAIPERAGGYVTGGTITNCGTESLMIVRTDGVESVNPNQTVKLRGWR